MVEIQLDPNNNDWPQNLFKVDTKLGRLGGSGGL